MTTATAPVQPAPMTPLMFCREVEDIDSHITWGWNEQAFCGAKPGSSFGWTLGTHSAALSGITLCEDCKAANTRRCLG